MLELFCRAVEQRKYFPGSTVQLILDGLFLPAHKIGWRRTLTRPINVEVVLTDHVYRFDAGEYKSDWHVVN
jgi:hypothetical protein